MPFPFEAALSGIRALPEHGYMWYRLPNLTNGGGPPGQRTLLKFEASDWQVKNTYVYMTLHSVSIPAVHPA